MEDFLYNVFHPGGKSLQQRGENREKKIQSSTELDKWERRSAFLIVLLN